MSRLSYSEPDHFGENDVAGARDDESDASSVVEIISGVSGSKESIDSSISIVATKQHHSTGIGENGGSVSSGKEGRGGAGWLNRFLAKKRSSDDVPPAPETIVSDVLYLKEFSASVLQRGEMRILDRADVDAASDDANSTASSPMRTTTTVFASSEVVATPGIPSTAEKKKKKRKSSKHKRGEDVEVEDKVEDEGVGEGETVDIEEASPSQEAEQEAEAAAPTMQLFNLPFNTFPKDIMRFGKQFKIKFVSVALGQGTKDDVRRRMQADQEKPSSTDPAPSSSSSSASKGETKGRTLAPHLPAGAAEVTFLPDANTKEIAKLLQGENIGGRQVRVVLPESRRNMSSAFKQRILAATGGTVGGKDPSSNMRYFLGLSLSSKCTRCGQVGHKLADCEFDPTPVPCHLCGGSDHDPMGCPNITCFRCAGFGHHSRDCRYSTGGGYPRRPMCCTDCGMNTHTSSNCPDPGPSLPCPDSRSRKESGRGHDDYEGGGVGGGGGPYLFSMLMVGPEIRCMTCGGAGHAICDTFGSSSCTSAAPPSTTTTNTTAAARGKDKSKRTAVRDSEAEEKEEREEGGASAVEKEGEKEREEGDDDDCVGAVLDCDDNMKTVYCPNCGEADHHFLYPKPRQHEGPGSTAAPVYCLGPKYEAFFKFNALTTDAAELEKMTQEERDSYYNSLSRSYQEKGLFPSLDPRVQQQALQTHHRASYSSHNNRNYSSNNSNSNNYGKNSRMIILDESYAGSGSMKRSSYNSNNNNSSSRVPDNAIEARPKKTRFTYDSDDGSAAVSGTSGSRSKRTAEREKEGARARREENDCYADLRRRASRPSSSAPEPSPAAPPPPRTTARQVVDLTDDRDSERAEHEDSRHGKKARLICAQENNNNGNNKSSKSSSSSSRAVYIVPSPPIPAAAAAAPARSFFAGPRPPAARAPPPPPPPFPRQPPPPPLPLPFSTSTSTYSHPSSSSKKRQRDRDRDRLEVDDEDSVGKKDSGKSGKSSHSERDGGRTVDKEEWQRRMERRKQRFYE